MKESGVSEYLLKTFGNTEETQKSILYEVVGENQAHLIFNRPKRLNAFSTGMYLRFCNLLDRASESEQIKYIVIGGAGDNFSSGNDLMNFVDPTITSIENKIGMAKAMAKMLELLTYKIIMSEKPIFCIVQGKVIGFAFTQLALYDKVFALQNCYFMAPLVKIAQGPEMASSYTFPKCFGQPLAEQIIIKGKPMTTQQLSKYNFCHCCENLKSAKDQLQKHIKQIDELDWQSYLKARKLMRAPMINNLIQANIQQNKNLVERWSNPDLPAYLMQYMSKKNEQKMKKGNL